MQPVSPCLAIDYGAAHTQAVLCRPGGSWLPVPLEPGSLELSSAVHSGADGTVVIGAQAWRRAADDPGGFVPSPAALRAGGAENVTVAGREVALAGLAAGTLRHVADRAAQLA